MQFIIFIGYILLSIVMGKHYSNKGRPFVAGLILSLLFSPLIAFIISLLFKD